MPVYFFAKNFLMPAVCGHSASPLADAFTCFLLACRGLLVVPLFALGARAPEQKAKAIMCAPSSAQEYNLSSRDSPPSAAPQIKTQPLTDFPTCL